MNRRNNYIDFYTATILKKLGFDSITTLYFYAVEQDDDTLYITESESCAKNWNNCVYSENNKEQYYSRPKYYEVLKWFREKYNIHTSIELRLAYNFRYIVRCYISIGSGKKIKLLGNNKDTYDFYEEAEAAAVNICLEYLKITIKKEI